jgi:lysozyme
MSYQDILKADLTLDEGERLKPYKDQFGNISIGRGRNLTGVGISKVEMEMMYTDDENIAEATAMIVFPDFWNYSDARKAALANLCFQLGQEKIETFTVFIALVNAQDWSGAANDLLNTQYAKQVPERAARRAAQLRSG